VHPDVGGPGDAVTLQLPEAYLNADGPNVITVFVESLGHHKGFYDDTREPRGLLSLLLDQREIHLEGCIAEAPLSSGDEEGDAVPNAKTSPVMMATTEFMLPNTPDTLMPMGLKVDLDVERVNITLNGVLLGKYWRACKNQTVFYLPEGILRPDGVNRLVLTLVNFLPPLSVENPFPSTYGEVKLISYQQYAKFSARIADTCSSHP
jgi:hypothetical protein